MTDLSRKMKDLLENAKGHQPAYRSVITWEGGEPLKNGLYLITAHSSTGQPVTDTLVWQDGQWWERDDEISWAMGRTSDTDPKSILLWAPLPEPPDLS